MKSVLITFDQAYYERIMALLDRLNCRGFTYLEKVQGRGSKTGDPLSSANPPSRWTDINRYPTASWFCGPLSRCR